MNTLNLEKLSSLLAHHDTSEGIVKACSKDSGTRFYRCAFQVNPFEYLGRHSKTSKYEDEISYNNAMVEACLENNIEVVAITDHFRYDSSSITLTEALKKSGIHVFPGFEANSSEGIHLLCIFPQSEDSSKINRYIGECGITNITVPSPQSEKTAEQISTIVSNQRGITIAAHVCSKNGLLTVLDGQARERCWKNKKLYAAAIPGKPSEVPDKYLNIILNKDQNLKRNRSLAIINANDVDGPEDLVQDSKTTLVKMSDVSIEGLRQAFLDHDSRIRLNSDTVSQPHTEIIAVAWEGGLLDRQSVRLNDGLNVLIGGRGAGKSTIIESIRHVLNLEPRGEEATRCHQSIVKNVLKFGSEISVLVHSPYPSPQYYLIKRIYGQEPHVYNEIGELKDGLRPIDVMGDIEIYGQHEISELTRKRDEIAKVLRRFVVDENKKYQKTDTLEKLISNSNSILGEQEKLQQLTTSLSALPELREKLKRFEDAGLDKKLESKTLIDEEENFLEILSEEIEQLKLSANKLCPDEIYEPIVPENYEKKYPNPKTLEKISEVQRRIISATERSKFYLSEVSKQSEEHLKSIKATWETSKKEVEKEYKKSLKDLAKTGIDGTAYISVREQISRISPKEKQKEKIVKKLEKLKTERKSLLISYESETAYDFRNLEKAANSVTKKLKGKVRVEISGTENLASLDSLISKHVNGQFKKAIEKLENQEDLSLTALANAIRKGSDELQKQYDFPVTAAEKFAAGGEALALEIEQHHLEPEALLYLNVGVGDVENWKSIEQLSTGQKATAVLLLLLLDADAPLIIDQPEDDLDNRFIVSSIVSSIKDAKKNRQFLFSSHNANIPVLGDADQIVGLSPVVEDKVEFVEIREELCGSIDTYEVKNLVKEILEGGQEAFEFRREKYGF